MKATDISLFRELILVDVVISRCSCLYSDYTRHPPMKVENKIIKEAHAEKNKYILATLYLSS